MSEQELTGQILDAINGIKGVHAWRNNTGVARTGGRFIRYGIKGQADISGILRGGRRLEIEVKLPDGKHPVTEEQKSFGSMVNGLGGVWFVARSVEEVVTKILEAMKP